MFKPFYMKMYIENQVVTIYLEKRSVPLNQMFVIGLNRTFSTPIVMFFFSSPNINFSMPNICVAYKRSKFSTQQRNKPHNDMYDLTFNVLGNSGSCAVYKRIFFFLSFKFKIKIKINRNGKYA